MRDPVHKKIRQETADPAQEANHSSCAATHSRNIWIVGCVVIALVAIFCAAMGGNQNSLPAQLPASSLQTPMMAQQNFGRQGFGAPYSAAAPLAQRGIGLYPRAFYGPNCPIYPNYAQPLVQDTGMQPAAVTNPHAGCPSFTQCFPPAGGATQPVAFTNPHAGCPSFTQCFPQGSATAVALTNPVMGAAAAAAPPIFRDGVMPHAFRGVCENCHIVNPDIPITFRAQLPHAFRGVCSNCHVISDLPPAV